MKRLQRVFLAVGIFGSMLLSSCSQSSVYGTYSFSMGSAKGTHFYVALVLTDDPSTDSSGAEAGRKAFSFDYANVSNESTDSSSSEGNSSSSEESSSATSESNSASASSSETTSTSGESSSSENISSSGAVTSSHTFVTDASGNLKELHVTGDWVYADESSAATSSSASTSASESSSSEAVSSAESAASSASSASTSARSGQRLDLNFFLLPEDTGESDVVVVPFSITKYFLDVSLIGKNAFFGTSSICYLYSSERDGWRTGFSASQMERMVASEMNWPSYPQAGKNMKSDLRMENDQLSFGSYPQSAADESMETLLEKKHPDETYAEENGYCFYFNRGHWYRYDPIEWEIIDKDGDDVLVISKKALVYHESSIDFSGYENSSGRKFLNSDFIDAAFSEKEKEKILTTKLDNSPYFFGQEYSSLPPDPETERCYASTEDKIFLLSYAEWERLLKGKEEDRLELTDYAKSFSKDWPDQFPWWWLRTISDVTSWYPLCVRPEFQSISPWKGDFFLYLRPAMWLRLGK